MEPFTSYPEVGQRVVLVRDVERYPLGIYRAGMAGTVAYVDPGALGTEVCGAVLLDDHRPELAEWGNELHVVVEDDPEAGHPWSEWGAE